MATTPRPHSEPVTTMHRLHGAPHETVTCYFGRLPRAKLPQRMDYAGFGHGLSFLLNGSGTLTDHHGERWAVAPGRFFRFVNDQASAIDYHGGADFTECGVYIQPLTARLLTGLGCLRPGPTVTTARDPALVVREFQALQRLLRGGDAGNAAVFSAVAALFALAEQQDPGRAVDEAVEQVRLRLGQDLDRRLSLPALARDCELPYRVLHTRFRQAYGLTMGGYRIRCRLDEAKRLLAHHPVQDAAQLLGYPDPFTFSKQFHHHVGMSPTAWRQRGTAVPSTLSAR